MYTKFFHMREMPFGLEPDSRFLVLAEEHKKALSTLVYAMREREGWALLLGEAGVGKTTLVMALLRKMGEAVIPAVITNPLLEPMDFFNLVALELGMEGPYESKGQFIIDLGQLINGCRQQNRVMLLVVDEAHSLTPRLLEELRLLGNLDGATPRVLNIFLVGQPKLLPLMKETGVRGLMQRLRRHYLLKPLSQKETAGYVRRRLEVAGGSPDIFDGGALQEVHYITGGTPRLINALCDEALLTAFSQAQRQVNRDLILQAAIQSTDLLWPQPEPEPPSETVRPEPEPSIEPVHIDLAPEAPGEEAIPEPPDADTAAETPLEATLGRFISESEPMPEPGPEPGPMLEPEPEPEAIPKETTFSDQEPPLEAPPSPGISESEPAPAPEPEPEPEALPDDIPESIRDLLEPAKDGKPPPGLKREPGLDLHPSPSRPKKRSGIFGRLLLFLVFILMLLAGVYLLNNPEGMREAARIWQTITIELGLEPSQPESGGQPNRETQPGPGASSGEKELRVKIPIPSAEENAPPPTKTPQRRLDDAPNENR